MISILCRNYDLFFFYCHLPKHVFFFSHVVENSSYIRVPIKPFHEYLIKIRFSEKPAVTLKCASHVSAGAEGCMGPVVMPPGKKAEGPSSGSVARGLSQLYQDTEAADLSLALSASLSRAEDEELTSLSWLHESTDLLTSLGHSGLRSVSPLQDANGGREPSSSPSSSPEPSEPPYHLSTGPSRKPPYSFSCLIFMAIEDAPSKRLPVKDIYGWILEHFPYFASAPTGWKNSVRHNLSLNKCFKKVDKDRSQVRACVLLSFTEV